MRKYLLASHGKLASGAFDSLKLFLGNVENVDFLEAYIDNSDFSSKIYDFMNTLSDNDQGIIFTDIYGGSVNQKVTAIMSEYEKNIYIIAGFNLPVLLEIMTSTGNLSQEEIEKIAENSKLKVINKSSLKMMENIDENNDFF